MRLSVEPIVGVVELDAPPTRVVDFEWGDFRVREHSSRFGTTASLKSFSANIDMLDPEEPGRVFSL